MEKNSEQLNIFILAILILRIMEPNLDDQPKLSLEEQIKAAERDKVIEEVAKAKSDRLKADLEYAKLKKEIETPSWQKGVFWQRFLAVFLGISFLGFYINYVIIPISTVENLQLKRKNEMDAQKIYESEKKFRDDSIKFVVYSDSLIKILNLKAEIINALKSSRDSLDKGYQILIKNYQEENNIKIQKATQDLIKLQNKYVQQVQIFSESNKNLNSERKINYKVIFDFVDENGKYVSISDGELTVFAEAPLHSTTNIYTAIGRINGQTRTSFIPIGSYAAELRSNNYYTPGRVFFIINEQNTPLLVKIKVYKLNI